MRFSLLFFYILFLIPSVSYGQTTLTTSQILSTAKNQPKFQLQNRKLDFLKNTPHQLPIFNRMEFRTQTHDLDFKEQQFTFRVRPNSRKERIGQQQLFLSNIQWYEEETRQVLLEGLQKRYATCLILFFSKKRLELMADLALIYKQHSIAYEKNNDLEKLLEIAEKEQDFSLQIFEYQREIEKAIRQTQYFVEDNANFVLEDTDFLAIEVLKERLEQPDSNESLITPSVSLLNSQINLIDKELKFEIAKQKKWFSFAQLKYGGVNPNTPFKETFSASLAFQLPIKGNAILKINDLKLDKIEAENAFGVQSYQIQKERKILARDLADWLKKQEQLSQNLRASQKKYNNFFIENNTPENAIISLKIKAHLLKKELTLKELEEKIYHLYIDWLALTGKMIELPLSNYLSIKLERF